MLKPFIKGQPRPKRRITALSVAKDQTTKAVRRLRAQKMVEDRVFGMSIAKMADKYQVHPNTVSKELRFANEEGLIANLEDRILRELVPLAIETYKAKMKEDKDAFVAKDVLTNLARLSEKQERRQKEDTSNTLEAYIRLRATKNDPTAKSLVTTASSITNAITANISSEDSEEVIEADVAAHSPTIPISPPKSEEIKAD